MMLPPTGTIKFLSVDDIRISTEPRLCASTKACVILEHYNPYALLTIWNKLFFLQISATSTTLSYARGAKQLVVVITHRTLSLYSAIAFSMPSRLVLSSSPLREGSIQIGFKLAVKMLFKHVF